jgi:MoaA/NifB/PqqE/SkfB family radical SAM enzyme
MANNNIRSHLIRLNMICNESCSFCNVTEITEPNYKDKTIFEILLEVQKIIKRQWWVNNTKISLSWWEPTLRKDIDKIVLWIKKLWIEYIELQTNATLLSDRLTDKLVNNGVNRFFISFHSFDKEIFEDYVWLKGIFNTVVKNIKNLWKFNNVEVIFNPVISKKNYANLEKYFDFVKKEFPFVKYISLSFIQPHWEAKKNIDLMLDYDFINKYLTWILDYAYKLWFILNNPYCWLPVCVLWWDKYNNNCIEVNEWKALIDSWSKRNDTNKEYIKECESCSYYWLCWWIWSEYINLYWNKWIKSI